jgi:hypothetical protein
MKARSVNLARYRRDLEARGLRPTTVRTYVRAVAEFLQALGGPPSRGREKEAQLRCRSAAELRPLARRHGRDLYELLLHWVSSTLLTLGRDPKWLGAQLGITTVLHTWARDLTLHPHAHCIVTAGGLSLDGARWVDTERDFLFPLAVLAKLFRGKFLAGLARSRRTHGVGRHLSADDFETLVDSLYKIDWNI